MAMAEDDGGHSSVPRLLFRYAPPALVTGALPDDHGSDRARRVEFPARTAFFLTSGIMLVLGLLVKCDGIGFVCFVIGWFAQCSQQASPDYSPDYRSAVRPVRP